MKSGSGKRVISTKKEEKKVFVKESDPASDSDEELNFSEMAVPFSDSDEEVDDNPSKKMRKEEKKEISNYDRDGFAENKRVKEKKVTYEGDTASSDSEEESESEEDNEIDPTSNYDCDGFPEHVYCYDGEESDEEIIRDRKEKDHGYNFILNKGRTITNPRRPHKTYIPRSSKHCRSVLHDLDHPLVVLAKLALARYNAIQGKNYQYYGLVKAYNAVVGAFVFWIRFKAFLTDQDPIDFEANVYQGIPDKPKPGEKSRDCEMDIMAVYPLP